MIDQLHFTQKLWLLALLFIPVVWLLYAVFYRSHQARHQLEKFIDPHLLPYLLSHGNDKKPSLWKALSLWTIVWICLAVALAGPRWNYREVETLGNDMSLVVLLDLSESMNATDVKPTRLIRAKQKIEDLINASKGIKIGLIGFAADPHMITPLTEDMHSIRHLLPSVGTDLIYVQGSRLTGALNMGAVMLQNEPGLNKALLVMSDGGFEDSGAIGFAKTLSEKGIVVHTMGVGTQEGAYLYAQKKQVFTKLEKERLEEVSKAGKGEYFPADYSNRLESVIAVNKQIATERKHQIWDEGFYFLIIPILPIFLWWFRRGYVIAALLFFFTPSLQATSDYFKNYDELGKEAFERGEYDASAQLFQDPYRKGVACYKAGQFAEAETNFRQSQRKEVALDALYNLGNALAMQEKFPDAIKAYEDVLKEQPDHTRAKENLELLKKMQEEQKQDSNQDNKENDESENKQDSNQDDKNDDESENKQDSNQDDKNDDESENKQDPSQDDKKDDESENKPDSQDQQSEKQEEKSEQEKRQDKSEEEQNADTWLNSLPNDPKPFLKNKCYLESKKNGTKEGVDPW